MPLKHTVQEVELSAGGKGLLVHVPDSTVVSCIIAFRAGYTYTSDRSIQQVAHLVEHIVANSKDSKDFSRNGANSGATTSQIDMIYSLACAQFEWRRILSLMQSAISNPDFTSDILEAEKGNVRGELTGNTQAAVREMLFKMDKAMGGVVLTDPEKLATLEKVSIEEVVRHYEYTHTRQNMRFVLAGDLGANTQEITELFEVWALKDGDRLALTPQNYHASDPVLVSQNDREGLNFCIYFMAPRRLTTPEFIAFRALNHILTGTFHSRIFGEARRRGICYNVRSRTTDYYADANMSNWSFSGQVHSDNADELFSLIRDELMHVLNGGLRQDEIDDAKQYLTGYYQMQRQTVSSLADWYAEEYLFSDTYEPLEDIQKHIDVITLDQVRSLAQQFMNVGIWTLGEVGASSEADLARHHKILAELFA